jgi:enoyl-CoA hydratase/carnithine racemase
MLASAEAGMSQLTKLKLERDENHAVILFDNPPMNVVSAPLTRELYRTLRELERDDAVRSLIITGMGSRAFCAGSDINEIQHLLEPGAVLEHKLIFQNKVFELLRNFPKPTIAALNGYTYGGGLEIAACCDFIIAEKQVRLCLPEIKLGVFPSSGGTYRIARKIGESRAKELIFFGDAIDAEQAHAWGLVNRITETGGVMRTAKSLAATLAQRPRLALKMAKSLVNQSFDMPEAQLIDRSLMASDRTFCSLDAQEGVTAFLDKREAKFS